MLIINPPTLHMWFVNQHYDESKLFNCISVGSGCHYDMQCSDIKSKNKIPSVKKLPKFQNKSNNTKTIIV